MKLFKVLLAVVILLNGLLTLNACQIESPIENYNWILISYGEFSHVQTPLEGTEISIFFDSEGKIVSGSGGCNHYSGTYEIDGLSLSIDERMAVTEMWCGEEIGEQERQYFEALQAAHSFKLEHGNLIIYGSMHKLIYMRQEEGE